MKSIMIISYISTNEGIGAQYQRIIGILAICKVHNFYYYHKPITVGHNYDNDPEWNNKWNMFFNIKNIDYNINITNINDYKQLFIPHTIDNVNFLNDINNIIYNFQNPHNIINKNPDLYYNSIIEDIRKVYDDKNKNLPLKFFIPNKKNVAIHIRTANIVDTEPHELLPGNIRYISNETYKKIIKLLSNDNTHIHIFTQASFNIDDIYTGINNISYHIDTDTFDTFHHFINADTLFISKSSFSYLAAIYNKNNIIYEPSFLVPLKHWTNINDLLL